MLKRQSDSSVSRTKVLNTVGLVAAAVLSVLPSFEVHMPPLAYTVTMAVFVVVNQVLRDTQTKL